MSLMLLRIYASLATLAAPLLRRHLHKRVKRGRELLPRLGERCGHEATPRPAGTLIWLHAASVGETMSIIPVIAVLLERPGVTVLVTTGTVTSQELLNSRIPAMGAAGRVLYRFVPLDVPRWVARFVAHWHPDVAGFVESEIWPNLLSACRQRGVPLMLVNARLSPSSHGMWRRVPGAARQVFGLFDAVLAQSDADAARLAALGARQVESSGNLKFATPVLPVDEAELARMRILTAGRPVWLAASTHPGEELIAGAVHRALSGRHPTLLTIIAPRHPHRGAAIAEELKRLGIQVTRRALGEGPPAAGIWLADTLGELGLLYRLVPIVFVGRSLALGGGQNPLEPARLGCAVAVGPKTANFTEAVSRLESAGALTVVADTAALTGWVQTMLRDDAARQAMGQAGLATASNAAGLPEHVAQCLLRLAGHAA